MTSLEAPGGRLPLRGSRVIAAIKESGIRYVISVPDRVTSDGLLRPIAGDGDLKLLRVCQEAEGYGVSAGLSYGGHRSLILIQHTGLLDSINALRTPAVEYRMPVCLMVGLLGKAPGLPLAEAKAYGVRIVEPILDAMGVKHLTITTDDDLAGMRPAIDEAYANSHPLVILLDHGPAES